MSGQALQVLEPVGQTGPWQGPAHTHHVRDTHSAGFSATTASRTSARFKFQQLRAGFQLAVCVLQARSYSRFTDLSQLLQWEMVGKRSFELLENRCQLAASWASFDLAQLTLAATCSCTADGALRALYLLAHMITRMVHGRHLW